MSKEKFVVVNSFKEETILPILPVAPILSSAAMEWDNIHVGYYRLPAWETCEASFLQHTITVYVGKPVNIELQSEGHWQKGTYTNGTIGIYPAYIPHKVNWNNEIEFINLALDPKIIAFFVDESVNCEIIPQFAIHDPLINSIGLALKTQLESKNLDCLYAQSAATMLAVHLLRNYCVQKHTIREYSGVPKAKLRQVMDYINTHLDRNLSLVELAQLVQMSPYYFARLFKQSTGSTPHQYILNCRIEKAQKLLAQPIPISEISQLVGFHDQSRFTSTFRKYTGITPKKYRDRL